MKRNTRIAARFFVPIVLCSAAIAALAGCGGHQAATTPGAIKASMQAHLSPSAQAKYDLAARAYLQQQAQLRAEAVASHAAPVGATAQPTSATQ
jgi:hypothetical protein